MKLATWNDGSRDGLLAVVSRDLGSAHFAAGIARTLQQVLDDWNFLSPQLEDLYTTLNTGKARHAFAFDARQCLAPLPRAYQWAEACAYRPHLERLWQAQGTPLPPGWDDVPLLGQRAGDALLGPCADAVFASAEPGIDFGAGLAVVTGDLASGSDADTALDGVRLLLLANQWALRELEPAERSSGLGLLQARPAAAFGPVAVTPDELGTAWRGGRVHLSVHSQVNGRSLGLTEAGAAMHFHFGQLIAQLARTRGLRAGCIVAGGVVANQDPERGLACLAELRAVEAGATGVARTDWLQDGDSVGIEVLGLDGNSVFGAIRQRVRLAPHERGA